MDRPFCLWGNRCTYAAKVLVPVGDHARITIFLDVDVVELVDTLS